MRLCYFLPLLLAVSTVKSDQSRDILKGITSWKLRMEKELKAPEINFPNIDSLIKSLEEKNTYIINEHYSALKQDISVRCKKIPHMTCTSRDLSNVAMICELKDSAISKNKEMQARHVHCMMEVYHIIRDTRNAIESSMLHSERIFKIIQDYSTHHQLIKSLKILANGFASNSELNLRVLRQMYGDLRNLDQTCTNKYPYKILNYMQLAENGHMQFGNCANTELRNLHLKKLENKMHAV